MEMHILEKSGFVYIWRDQKHNRYYVGCHWGFVDDGYICSSPWMIQSYNKRPNDFKRRILKSVIVSRKETYIEEQKWLNLIKKGEISPNTSKPRYYNLNITNNEIWHKYDEKIETISEKISVKTKEAMWEPEVREKYLKGLGTRNTRSSDFFVRKKRSNSMKGKNVGKVTVRFANDPNGKAFHVSVDDSRLVTGKVVHISTGVKKGPLKEDQKEFLRNNSHFHTINNTKIKCDHCEFKGTSAHISRWHNKNCKKKTMTCLETFI